MTVTDIQKDPQALTMTVNAAFDAPIEATWQLWQNPRLLERWWGPPTYPATVVEHDLTPGGTVRYTMTGPEGDTHGGYWLVQAVDAPRSLEIEDGFSDESGTPNPDMPTTRMRVTLSEPASGGTRMTIETIFPSAEAMEQLVAMGMEEGIREAAGQMDALLAAQIGQA